MNKYFVMAILSMFAAAACFTFNLFNVSMFAFGCVFVLLTICFGVAGAENASNQ